MDVGGKTRSGARSNVVGRVVVSFHAFVRDVAARKESTMSREDFSRFALASLCLVGWLSGCDGVVVDSSQTIAKAQLVETNIDFGLVDCGGTSTRKVSIKNVGFAPLTFEASVSAAAFGVTPAEGSIEPGEEATLTVTSTFSGAVQAGTSEEGALTIATNDVDNETLSVPLKAKSAGVTLTLEPGVAALGESPVGITATPLPLTLSNSGNVVATIAFRQPADAQFWLDWTGAPSVVTVPAGESFSGLSAMFTAQRIEPSSAVAGLTVAQASCGASVSEIPMTGQGTSWPAGTVAFEPSKLDFGHVDCGTTAAPQTVTFTNGGRLDYTLSAKLGRGPDSPYTIAVNPMSGVVAAGEQLTITVTPAGIPQTSPVTPGVFSDTLIITTNVPDEDQHEIELGQIARGAIFSIAATKLNFGSVAMNAEGAAQFSVSNLGNAPGKLIFDIPQIDPFFLPDTEIAGGSSVVVTGKFSPREVASFNSRAGINVGATTVLCLPLPTRELELSGFGIDDPVVAVSPSSLTFGPGGMVDCGDQAAAQALTLRSYSTESLNIEYALDRGEESPFTVDGPHEMGPNGNMKISVIPKTIPTTASTRPDAYGDTLSILAIGESFEEMYVVSLFQTAQGAVFSFAPETLSLANSGLLGANAASKSFSVRNDGNILASFTLSLTGSHPGAFSISPAGSTVGAGAAVGGSVTLPAFSKSSRQADLVLSSPDTLCGPSPVKMTLTGN